jgi:hypothetical protein
MFYLHICPFVRRGTPNHGSTLEQGREMTLVPLIFSSLKQMSHTAGPSSTSERSDMATKGALRRRPRSLVAHHGGHSHVSPSGELAPADPAGAQPHWSRASPRGSSTPPARDGNGWVWVGCSKITPTPSGHPPGVRRLLGLTIQHSMYKYNGSKPNFHHNHRTSVHNQAE